MIEPFVRGIRNGGVTVDYRDLQDILWLSCTLPTAMTGAVEAGAGQRPQDWPVTPHASAMPASGTPPVATTRQRRTVTVSADLAPGVYVPSLSPAQHTRRASSVRIPGAPALPGGMEIARALRPFMRRRISRRLFEFDPETTVERFADTGVLAAVRRPARRRWFDVALVIDNSPSMVVWKQTAAELYRLLGRHGAFRDVRRWTLIDTDAGVQLASESGLVHDWRELRDAMAERLVLLVSDCVAPYWERARIWTQLAALGQVVPTTIVQVLPERLWPGTAIGGAANIARNRLPGAANTLWAVERPWWAAEDFTPAVFLPIVTLESRSIDAWARLVMGGGGATAPATPARPPAPAERSPEHGGERSAEHGVDDSAEGQVRRYKAFVSPTAYRLAVFLSAVPLNLQVMRLVQRAMLPGSRQVHLAEFFVGGLIERVTSAAAKVSPDEVEYDFLPGVRSCLQASFTRSDALQVLGIVSRYVDEQFGSPLDFRALVPDPRGPQALPAAAIPFASAGRQLLMRIGHAPRDHRAVAPGTFEEEEFAPGLTIRLSFLAATAISGIAWSKDGEKLALACEHGAVVVEVSTGRLLEAYAAPMRAASVAWATDRDELAVADAASGTVAFVSPASRRTVRVGPELEAVAWRPAGDTIAVSPAGPTIAFVKGDQVVAREEIRGAAGRKMMAWSNDGTTLAIISEVGMLILNRDGDQTGIQAFAPADPINLPAICWHPSLPRLAASATGEGIAIVDAARGVIVQTLDVGGVRSLSFSRDGRLLAIRSNARVLVVRTDSWTEVSRSRLTLQKHLPALAFSPAAGELAVVEGNQVHFLRVQAESLLREPMAEPAPLPLRVFISSAAGDEALVEPLRRQLTTLALEGVFELVGLDDEPQSGTWQRRLIDEIASVELFIALVSRRYLGSELARSVVAEAEQAKVRVIPILLEPCDFADSPLAAYQALPAGGRPLTDWDDPQAAMMGVVAQLREIAIPWATRELLEAFARATVAIEVEGGGAGSGLLLGEAGRILTTEHLVAARAALTVVSFDGRRVAARSLATNRGDDLALLEAADVRNRPPVFSSASGPGDLVVASFLGGRPMFRVSELTGSALMLRPSGSLPLGGAAGAPVFDQRGAVVGLIRAAEGDQVACVPANRLISFLEEQRPVLPGDPGWDEPEGPASAAADLVLECFPVKSGDCLMLEYGKETARSRVLVDGGRMATYADYLAPRIASSDLPFTIDLAIATHLHGNHLEGLLELFRDTNAQVQSLVINPLDWLVSGDSVLAHRSFYEALSRGAEADSLGEGAVLANEAVSLPKERIGLVRRGVESGLRLELQGLSVTIVCPTPAQLGRARKRLEPLEVRFRERRELNRTDLRNVERALFDMSALAVLLEYRGIRLLLTSDGYSDQILEGLAQVRTETGPLRVDLLQIPSHGDAGHLSDALLKQVVADHYLVSGATSEADVKTLRERIERVKGAMPFALHVVGDTPERIALWAAPDAPPEAM